MAYYSRLRDLKEDMDLTQKKVADIIGVSVNHYGKYERGETDIPFEKVIVLAEHYNVSLDYIAGRTNIREIADNKMSYDELQVAKKYAFLSERNKGKLELFMDQLINSQNRK